MGRDGSMYLLIENPGNVDQLGNTILREEKLIEENPPVTDRPDRRPKQGYVQASRVRN